ncbi:ribonuclease HII [Candidatus Gracilibacteria bacterium]|nr:ribonuclease HII [Candidatus Gracilibacteria bacterium]
MKVYIDEAGRGPLAGPLYVGLVIPLKRFSTKNFKDSKKLSEKKREECFIEIKKLQSQGKLIYITGSVSPKQIDKYGITKSINLAIKSGLKKLIILSKTKYPGIFLKFQKLIIDGNTDFGLSKDLKIPVKTVIKGDDKVPYISMASIVAKVSRDCLMKKIHKKYPQYGFDIHKGYGTKLHYNNIKKYGISDIHRKLFLRNLKDK